jgi:hypothetical protein
MWGGPKSNSRYSFVYVLRDLNHPNRFRTGMSDDPDQRAKQEDWRLYGKKGGLAASCTRPGSTICIGTSSCRNKLGGRRLLRSAPALRTIQGCSDHSSSSFSTMTSGPSQSKAP